MRIQSLFICFAFLITACGSSNQENNESTESLSTNEITLNQDQVKVLDLKIGNTQSILMSSTLDIQGKIDLPPQNIISVNFPLGGYLRSTKLITGMHVQKGEVIAIMEDQAIVQLQQDYLSAKAKSALVSLDFERQRNLVDANAGTSKNFGIQDATSNGKRVG